MARAVVLQGSGQHRAPLCCLDVILIISLPVLCLFVCFPRGRRWGMGPAPDRGLARAGAGLALALACPDRPRRRLPIGPLVAGQRRRRRGSAVAMSARTLPLLFLNLGGEMLYILDQRLRAQSIPGEKARKGERRPGPLPEPVLPPGEVPPPTHTAGIAPVAGACPCRAGQRGEGRSRGVGAAPGTEQSAGKWLAISGRGDGPLTDPPRAPPRSGLPAPGR